MKHSDIAQTVVRYLAGNADSLEGALPGPGYFLAMSGSDDDRSRNRVTYLTRGAAVDVLAWMMEKERFFNPYATGPEHATNVNSGRISKLQQPITSVSGNFDVEERDNGLYIVTHNIDRRSYLDNLRAPEGFKGLAEFLGVEGDLERIAWTLYQ